MTLRQRPDGVLIAAHASKIYGPVQALWNDLKAHKTSAQLVELPFSYSGLPGARRLGLKAGLESVLAEGHAAQGWDPWLWTKDFFFVLRQGWQASREEPIPLFIGVDCLNAAAGIVLRAFGRVKKVAFYVIDYTPQRFSNPVLNHIYAAVDRFAAKRSDVVWNLSVRMQDVRREQGVSEARNQRVPVGVELKKVHHPPRTKVRRKALLYMGALHDNKGLQLMVQAFPKVLKAVPGAELHIIGFGPFEAELKRLVAASPARARIKVPGGLDHASLFKVVPTFGVALAPYLDDPGSYTWWCDPTKPKEYLACGLPLILTKVPWIWERVAESKRPLGIAIDYKEDQLVKACVKLLKDQAFYWRCRRNALDFAKDLSWTDIYDRAFAGLDCA